MSGMQSLVSQLPLQHASMLFLPVRILTSPITTLASMARESATRLGPPAGGLAAAIRRTRVVRLFRRSSR